MGLVCCGHGLHVGNPNQDSEHQSDHYPNSGVSCRLFLLLRNPLRVSNPSLLLPARLVCFLGAPLVVVGHALANERLIGCLDVALISFSLITSLRPRSIPTCRLPPGRAQYLAPVLNGE